MKMYIDKRIVCQKSEKESLVSTSFTYYNKGSLSERQKRTIWCVVYYHGHKK